MGNARHTAPQCEQQNCTDAATCAVCWPGREPLPNCDAHGRQASGIATAMGFYVVVESLRPETVAADESEVGNG